MDKIVPPTFNAPKAGFLLNDKQQKQVVLEEEQHAQSSNVMDVTAEDFVFAFADPIVREPKCPTPPPPPKPSLKEIGIQTEVL